RFRFSGSERRVTPLAELLADRIRRFGPITFADYMRECLYHPVHGYYSKAESKRFADYYTSADVHPIFARLLARQFAEMWETLGRPEEFTLVEGGAGAGRFASQVLDFCEAKLPVFYDSLRYVAVERSAAWREQATVGWKRATGSVKLAGVSDAATCSRLTTAIPRATSLTSTTCAARCWRIRIIAPAKIFIPHRASRI